MTPLFLGPLRPLVFLLILIAVVALIGYGIYRILS